MTTNKDINEQNKLVSKIASKIIPGAGTVYSGYEAMKRAREGDYPGAMISAAGMIPGPVGWAAMGADVMRGDKEEPKQPEQPKAPEAPKPAQAAPQINTPKTVGFMKFDQEEKESGGKSKMTGKKKSISEALAEVQRNAELKRVEEAKAIWGDSLQVDEASLLKKGADVLGDIYTAAKGKITGKGTMDVKSPSGRTVKMDRGPKTTQPSPQVSPAPAGSTTGRVAGNIAAGGLTAAAVGGATLVPKATTPAAAPSPSTADAAKPEAVKPAAPKMSFKQAFSAARKEAEAKGSKSTGQFEWEGKKFQTNIKGTGTAKKPEEKYVSMSKQTSVGATAAPAAAAPAQAAPKVEPKKETPPPAMVAPSVDTMPKMRLPDSMGGSEPSSATKFSVKPPSSETESEKKVRKMSEENNPLIAAFLDLQSKNPANMFEAAKKMSPKENSLASLGHPKDKITKKDVLIGRGVLPKEVEEGMMDPNDPSVQGSGDVTSTPAKKAPAPKMPTAPKTDSSVQGSGDVTKDGKPTRVKEEAEVTFSQAEIDHINSFFLEASVAPTRPEVATGADSTSDKMSQNDVTGTAESGKKIRKEEVELEEGRPKKNPTPETTERDPRKHIQVEAGRAAAGNVVDFHHNDGSKSKITPAMGRKIVSHLQSLKPADRQSAVNKMHDSAEGLKV